METGDVAVISVKSDTRGYVHVHTYEDQSGPHEAVGPGTVTKLTFSTEKPEIYYLEFHGANGSRGILGTIVVDQGP